MGAEAGTKPFTRSSNHVRTATRVSLRCTAQLQQPCRAYPARRSATDDYLSGNAPVALRGDDDRNSGQPASVRSSADASDVITPPPMFITGAFASAIRSVAARIRLRCGLMTGVPRQPTRGLPREHRRRPPYVLRNVDEHLRGASAQGDVERHDDRA